MSFEGLKLAAQDCLLRSQHIMGNACTSVSVTPHNRGAAEHCGTRPCSEPG